MFSTMDANEEVHLSSCIHGYHVYNVVCSATVVEELHCVKKLGMQRTDRQSPILHPTSCRCVVAYLPQ